MVMSPFCINFEREIIMILNEVLHLCLSSIVKNGSETKLRSFKVCNLKISPCTCSLVSAKNLKVRLLKSCELFTAVTKGYKLLFSCLKDTKQHMHVVNTLRKIRPQYTDSNG